MTDIRVPVRDLSHLDRAALLKLSKAGLKAAEVELQRRKESMQLYHIPMSAHHKRHKHKTDWESE